MNSMRMGYTVLPPLMRASSSAPTPKAATEAKLLPRRAEHTVKSPRGSKMTAPANTLPRTGTQNSREISSTVCPRLPGKTYLYQALNYTFTTSIAIYKTTNKRLIEMNFILSHWLALSKNLNLKLLYTTIFHYQKKKKKMSSRTDTLLAKSPTAMK